MDSGVNFFVHFAFLLQFIGEGMEKFLCHSTRQSLHYKKSSAKVKRNEQFSILNIYLLKYKPRDCELKKLKTDRVRIKRFRYVTVIG